MKAHFLALIRSARFQQLAFYLLLGMLFLPFYRYQLNSDGISYLSIAAHYLAGDTPAALNGYWSPLYSWLLMPFLSLGIAPILSSKLLNLLIGALCLQVYLSISHTLLKESLIYHVLGFAISPLLVWYSLYIITPDLLSLCILLCYLRSMLKYVHAPSGIHAIRVGIWASLGYLTKAYLFPFVLLHFFCSHLWTAVTSDTNKPSLFRGYLIGMAIFFLLSLPWMYLLSKKYQQVSVSTAAAYNHGIFSPEVQGKQVYLEKGLLAPPHPTATSIWEDPSTLAPPAWSPFQSQQHLQWQFQLIFHNLGIYFKKLEARSLFPFVLLFSVWYFRQPKHRRHRDAEHLVLSFFLYPSGYLLLVLEHRYIQLNYVLGYLFLAFALQRVASKRALWKHQVLLAAFSIYLILTPLARLITNRDRGKVQYEEAQQLRETLSLNDKKIASEGDWDLFITYAYHASATYYGMPRKDQPIAEIEAELFAHDIDYYFTAYPSSSPLQQYTPIDTVFNRYLVYQRNARTQ